jgi:hypothetical protein
LEDALRPVQVSLTLLQLNRVETLLVQLSQSKPVLRLGGIYSSPLSILTVLDSNSFSWLVNKLPSYNRLEPKLEGTFEDAWVSRGTCETDWR